MIHKFQVELAIKYGVDAALLIEHFVHGISWNYNIDNDLWICESIESLRKEFPYFSVSRIRTIIRKLKAKNVIHVKRFLENENGGYPNCYTIVDKEILDMFGLDY